MITCARLETMPAVRSVSMFCIRLTDFNKIQPCQLENVRANNGQSFSCKGKCVIPRYVLLTFKPNSDGHSHPALKIMKFMYATIVCAQFPVSFANVCAPTPTTYTDWMCKRYISAG